jgi:hypothetical protein
MKIYQLIFLLILLVSNNQAKEFYNSLGFWFTVPEKWIQTSDKNCLYAFKLNNKNTSPKLEIRFTKGRYPITLVKPKTKQVSLSPQDFYTQKFLKLSPDTPAYCPRTHSIWRVYHHTKTGLSTLITGYHTEIGVIEFRISAAINDLEKGYKQFFQVFDSVLIRSDIEYKPKWNDLSPDVKNPLVWKNLWWGAPLFAMLLLVFLVNIFKVLR